MKSFSYFTVRKNLFKEAYASQLSRYKINFYDWYKNPYSKFKTDFNLEVASLMLYFLLKTNISPNAVTIFNVLMAIFGTILFLSENITHLYLAVIIFFLITVPDWIDGHLARLKKKTSRIGKLMDSYSGILINNCFQLGLTFYVVNKSGEKYFYYMIIVIFIKEIFQLFKYINKTKKKLYKKVKKNFYSTFLNIIKNFLKFINYDGRARYRDLVLFIIILETLMPTIFVTWFFLYVWSIISLIILIRSSLR